ncbi:hypothetical protein K402DRAFT_419009 [Aulographum hederae CBS 113979]|uniref:Uncharacterized protein n=1 Tax=Aulographum hederae CBS 113979 TaxID=1176131 RepID=A0A6G1H850_9PEZI|nr:hypothetical protein K402DRAFT_419009 [Aulographum hederae CBS 113979]
MSMTAKAATRALSNGENSQSPWIDDCSLPENGWKDQHFHGHLATLTERYGSMARSLGLSMAQGDNFKVRWTHRESAAVYDNTYNPKDGILYAEDNHSPSQMQKYSHATETVIPELNRWSDVAFLTYEYLAREAGDDEYDVKGIKYIQQTHVMNADTQRIVAEVIERTGGVYQKWDRAVEISMDSEEGRALIGTPNGVGTAWFLMCEFFPGWRCSVDSDRNHKKQLGVKSIRGIKVYKMDTCPDDETGTIERCRPNLLFYFQDVDGVA